MSVRFSLDGRGIVDDATAPYTSCFSTATLAAGPHTLTASTYDDGGRRASSTVTRLRRGDAGRSVAARSRPPAVVLTEPAGATKFGDHLCPVASATDDRGVVGVRFFLDGELVIDDDSAPYGTCLPTEALAPGKHTLSAEAEDAVGGKATSTVTVTKAG